MNSLSIFTLKVLRKLYTKAYGGYQLPPLQCEKDPDKASEMVYNLLASDKPCMIARFGATEMSAIINYLGVNSEYHSFGKFIKGEQPEWWWNKNIMNQMQRWSGFFPPTSENMQRFGEMMIEDIKQLDFLLSWLDKEVLLSNNLKHCKLINSFISEPYFFKNPWTRVLANKKVLVVHPFAESIQKQYKRKELLFKNPNILPDFELKTIKAIQSLGGNSEFKDWFEALDYMKREIDRVDYDICLIGCGAYGFPLAAHVKRMGKQSVHLGGVTQLLFGIMGNRWLDPNYSKSHNYKNELFNSYWIRPNQEEIPETAKKVEGSCYW